MSDYAHEKTDEIIAKIEKRMEKEYAQAAKEVEEKYADYMRRYAIKDEIKRKQVDAGTLSQEEYIEWRTGQICIGQRWADLKDSLAQDLVNTNSIARSAIYEHTDEVYALNHNYATYQVEHDSLIDTSYTLYNRRAVEYLVKDDPNLLPYWEKPENKKKLEKIDKKWNVEKIGTSITQGVIQGESIPQISKRLETIVGMNKASAVRNARTIMTGTENKARQDAYDDLKSYGIDLEEQWIATLDSRTRSSHRWLHGTTKDPKTGEYENGLHYPGDPSGAPEEIYNCRCCEIATVLGHSIATPKYSPKLGDMSYEEWREAKGKPKWKENASNPVGIQKTAKQFTSGEDANKYFGQRPERSLRRSDPEEYQRQREEYENSSYKIWYDSLTENETKAITNYTADDYAGINGLLRHRMTEKMVDSWNQGKDENMSVENMIGYIETGINKFELKEPIKVFRTCDPNILQDNTFQKGSVFKDNAYVSSTVITEKVASGNVVMEIDLPAGTGIGAWINPLSYKQDEEYEFLINRGAMFEVTDVYERGDDTVIAMKWAGREPEEWSYATKEHVLELWDKEGLDYDKDILNKI